MIIGDENKNYTATMAANIVCERRASLREWNRFVMWLVGRRIASLFEEKRRVAIREQNRIHKRHCGAKSACALDRTHKRLS